MLLEDRIHAFAELGKFLGQFNQERPERDDAVLLNETFFEPFQQQIKRSHEFNGWFTQSNIIFALNSWSKLLTVNNLTNWTSNYTFNNSDSNVAIIMAGNIPLVGFHDFLSVLISGKSALVKLASNDKQLLPLIASYLKHIEPQFENKIVFTEEKLQNFDAAIATGSNNTARYFDYYFGKYPNIIRKNRNSIAVLTGNESQEELQSLGEDVFRYFGLGCRSVSKLFVPRNYNFDKIFGAFYEYRDLINYKKYQNNYDYNKTVYLMSEFDLLDNGFLTLKEDTSYSSPIASLFYEYYDTLDQLQDKLQLDAANIQCLVSNTMENAVQFGQTQEPQLTDYADGVDTLAFLSSL